MSDCTPKATPRPFSPTLPDPKSLASAVLILARVDAQLSADNEAEPTREQVDTVMVSAKEVRRDALEEAAKLADIYAQPALATDIRALAKEGK